MKNIYMVNAQEWLDKKYPKKDRSKVKEIDISIKKLSGDLNLAGFAELEKLECYRNQLTSLNLSDCSWLKILSCHNNQLIKLTFPNLNQLKLFWCSNNYLTRLDYSVFNPVQLTVLSIFNNNFSNHDLTVFGHFINLEWLLIGNTNSDKINQNVYNRWTGSLAPLQKLTKLEWLDISNTDLNQGVEYLPESLSGIGEHRKSKFYYDTNLRPECKLQEITKQLDLFTNKELLEPWKNLGFTLTGIIHWMKIGLKKYEYDFASYLVQQGYHLTTLNLEQIVKEESWRDIQQYFTYPKRTEWEKAGFNKEQTRELIKIGFKPNEHQLVKAWKEHDFATKEVVKSWIEAGFSLQEVNYVQEWKDLNITAEQIKLWKELGFKNSEANQAKKWLDAGFVYEEVKQWKVAEFNNLTELEKEYYINNDKLSNEAIKLIKNLSYRRDDLTKEQGSLISKIGELIPHFKLKERCQKFGFCSQCQQPKTTKIWCQFCSSLSTDQEINEFIRQYQSNAKNLKEMLEWIPYEQFSDIEFLAKGGFSEVYKAKWFTRSKRVALKILNNSQSITSNFLQEIASHKLFSNTNKIVKCHGISQEPKTRNYVMVMEYIHGGNLQQHSQNNQLSFSSKLKRLCYIAEGLKNIHERWLIHKDFHSGNILSNYNQCWITDLGLCCPVNNTDDGQIYGVLPYIAPEVLQGKRYTEATDIYSFGMVAYEVLSDFSPYCNKNWNDEQFIWDIIEGKRPKFHKKVPQLLKDLIARCWDADPAKRPMASELEKTLNDWYEEARDKKNTELAQQIKEAEESNKSLPTISSNYQWHPSAIYTSRLINIKPLSQPRTNKNWTNLHLSFTSQLVQSWTNANFTYPQAQEWISVGFQPHDWVFCKWLRDTKQLTPEQVLNNYNLGQLKTEYQQYQTQIEILPK